ncbi:zinc ribbon domain-containing protein [Butyrivibrio sp. WCD2001]|uniref:zinc ribbon domain-containing protein n=1 Tax=Butyrivibrio sp. WCD2001 TaxID=1280681 RepID=UPI0004182B08|nr:zinc ribbon domain-containing protein [Butyrivibrio sp. WCD2001]
MKCPKCGADITGNFCPYCGSNLQQPQQTTSNQQDSIPKVGGTYSTGVNYSTPTYITNPQNVPKKKKHSALGIIAFVLSFLGPLALIGIILAIIDLVKDKDKSHKHGLTIAAIVIGCLMLLFWAIPSSSTTNNETNVTSTSEEESIKEADSSKQVDEESDTASNETTEEAAPESEESTETVSESEESTDNAETVSESEENSEPAESESTDKEPSMTKDEFIASCSELNYKDIAREPEKYIGQNFYFTCYVTDVREGGLLSGYQKYFVTYAFDMEKAQKSVDDGWSENLQDAKYYGMDSDKCVWIMDNRDENDPDYIKVLDNDIVTVYGTFTGMTETKNSLTNEKGEQVSLDLKYVDLLAQ